MIPREALCVARAETMSMCSTSAKIRADWMNLPVFLSEGTFLGHTTLCESSHHHFTNTGLNPGTSRKIGHPVVKGTGGMLSVHFVTKRNVERKKMNAWYNVPVLTLAQILVA